jgi:hypothetical protein
MSQAVAVEVVIRQLIADPQAPNDAKADLPSTTGLYAWWAAPSVLSDLTGPAHPDDPTIRLLYVGIATGLRSRIAQNHLRRSGSSTLRRTLAGLLLDAEMYRTHWTSRVVLVDEDETRLTAWMTQNLRASWCEHPAPRDVEPHIIGALCPPLNVGHSTGPLRDLVKAARQSYYASAGPRPAT